MSTTWPYFLLSLPACLSCSLLIYQHSVRFNLVVGSLLSPLDLCNMPTSPCIPQACISKQNDIPSQPPQAEDWITTVTLPKLQTLAEVTCVYGINGKCFGTITPQRLIILQDAYNSARHEAYAESPCSRPCDRNPRTSSSTPKTFSNRQQYQGWMLTLSGSVHPIHDSLSQPCPSHKRKNGLTSRLYSVVSRVLDSPPKRQSIWFQDRRVLYTSPNSPSATRCMTINTCSK